MCRSIDPVKTLITPILFDYLKRQLTIRGICEKHLVNVPPSHILYAQIYYLKLTVINLK